MVTIKKRKQRKDLFNSPQHKKRNRIASHLEENLLLKYDKRAVPVIKGDTVKLIRGSFRGHEDKVTRVNVTKMTLEIEGITMTKADGNKIAKPTHPSNVIITKLNLTDKWRRKKLERGLSEETKKEIEKEAEKQIKDAEEERKLKEAEEKALEEEKETEEETTEKVKEPPKKDTAVEPKKEEKIEKKETKPKKTEVKKDSKTKTQIKTTTTKKPAKKKKTTTKKSPKKQTKKKEEDK